MGRTSSMHEREGEVHIRVWLGNLSEKDHLEHRRRWEDNIRADLKNESFGRVWTWLRIGTSGGL